MSISIYTVEEAQARILRRYPLDQIEITPRLQASIARIFGEALTPEAAVQRILHDVRAGGDTALLDWIERIDGHRLQASQLVVTAGEIQAAYAEVDERVVKAMQTAAERIEAFHRRQPVTSWIDTQLGGVLGQMVSPIERVGVYCPAGTAPLPSSLLMSAIPARVAGVREITACSPADRNGKVHPLILVAADIAGVDRVLRIGGAQAIAALAYGTETVRPVDKIVGPGNIFVVLAKRAVYGTVGIEGLPGPTETLVIADSTANPAFAAADLLAQAEHDVLASAILLTPDAELARKVQTEVERQLSTLSRQEILAESLGNRSGIVIVDSLQQACELANTYAPEHLCLLVEQPWQLVPHIRNAGGIFLGEYSFEVLGDYVAGPSHVMPVGGTARFASPLNVLDFVKLTSLIDLSRADAVALSAPAAELARAESLTAHEAAARQRTRTNGRAE
ncbi:MAG: histidinol dehydrogenase [Chloroflexota bacterium]|nr:MAG: histidinol dehydrogenase [Chloroflexota bacterium]